MRDKINIIKFLMVSWNSYAHSYLLQRKLAANCT